MPYKLVPAGTKFYVENKETGRRFSNRPMPKERAIRQMRALYAVENGYILRSRSKKSSPYNVRSEKRVANSRRRSMMQGGKRISEKVHNMIEKKGPENNVHLNIYYKYCDPAREVKVRDPESYFHDHNYYKISVKLKNLEQELQEFFDDVVFLNFTDSQLNEILGELLHSGFARVTYSCAHRSQSIKEIMFSLKD